MTLLLIGAGCTPVTWEPPTRFQGEYGGEIIATYETYENVSAICRMLIGPEKPNYYGCAIERDGVCLVIAISETTDRITPASVYSHEVGHCNGWLYNHPE